jgi:GMP synthase (glutamine-hydrolysing)
VGGEVVRSPKGREIGFARNIFPTEAGPLMREGFFADAPRTRAYVEDLRALDPGRREIAWRLGVGEDVLDPVRHRTELINFVEGWMRPATSAGGRA